MKCSGKFYGMQVSMTRSLRGPLTVCPNTSLNGLNPWDSSTDLCAANNSIWIPSSQSFSVSKQ